MLLRFNDNSLYLGEHASKMQGVHCLITLSFLLMFFYNGIYSKKRYTMTNALNSSFLATLLFFAMVYFVKSLAFSRAVFALSSIMISLLLIAYRELIPLIVHRFKRLVFSPERIVVLGSGAISAKIIKNIETQKSGDIIGIVWDSNSSVPSEYQGYQVIGTYETLRTVFQNHKVDMLLIATQQPWYSWVIDVLSNQKIKNVTIRWVSHELFEKAPEELPDEIELLDFAV